MELKPIKYKKSYEKIIADKITVWFWNNIFGECFRILDSSVIYNDADIIRNALERGLLYYQDGAFYSYTGRFRNEIALELEKMGARYSKYRKAYLIDKSKLPTEILWAIDTIKANVSQRVSILQAFLSYQLGELPALAEKLVFEESVNEILKDLQERTYKNAQERKIEFITPKLTDFRANSIAQRYTQNLDFWIKNWTAERIIKMREAVGVMAVDGKSTRAIAEYIHKEFGISARHAQFLARNEAGLATTAYLAGKYEEEGITQFRWHTNIDGRERKLHKELNGQIFRFDNPPIIDDRTGERGLPAETYNCLTGDMNILSPFPNFRIFKRKFAGELTTLVLPMGNIKITANHPVLTNRGWVVAKDIQIGDKVAKISDKRLFACGTNPYNAIPTIDEFFSFYEVLFNSQRVDHTDFDFHGDTSIDQKVDIINIKSKLWDYFKPEFSQSDFEFILSETDKIFKSTASDNSFFKAFPIGRFIPDNIISIFSKAFSFFFGSESHTVEHRLGAVAWLDIVLNKTIGYNITTNRKFFCELFNTQTLTEQTYKFIVWDIFYTIIYKFMAKGFGSADNCFAFNAEHLAQLSNGLAASIKFDTVQDKIISVFSGHIFNLQNLNNWYYTNYYITKNCRCTMSPVITQEFWENRKKLYQQRQGFFKKLKGYFDGKN